MFERLPPLPDPEGFAGMFAGVSHGVLLAAGGANFPGKKPWEGGAKVWYDSVFALDKPDGTWRKVGTLPRPLGYGVSANFDDRVFCVGGSDKAGHRAEVFSVEWKDGRLGIRELPALPTALANMAAAIVGDTLHIVGGQAKPDGVALDSMYTFCLSKPKEAWKKAESLPVPGRMLATATVVDGELFILGGAEIEKPGTPTARRYLKDGYVLRKGKWIKLPDMPHPVVAAPIPAPTEADSFFVIPGDDGSRVGFEPPEKHPGFRTAVLRFDIAKNEWSKAGEWNSPRAVLPAVFWKERWVLISGEAKPGVRSPEVWSFAPAKRK